MLKCYSEPPTMQRPGGPMCEKEDVLRGPQLSDDTHSQHIGYWMANNQNNLTKLDCLCVFPSAFSTTLQTSASYHFTVARPLRLSRRRRDINCHLGIWQAWHTHKQFSFRGFHEKRAKFQLIALCNVDLHKTFLAHLSISQVLISCALFRMAGNSAALRPFPGMVKQAHDI